MKSRVEALSKIFFILLIVIVFLLCNFLINFFIKNEDKKYKLIIKNIKRSSKLILKILNVTIKKNDGHEFLGLAQKDLSKRGQLIVANHLSYIDMLILSLDFPSLFITSTEIRETFFLGAIAKMAGCFFVERRKEKRNSETKKKEIEIIKKKLNQGFNVFLFPEGTSSAGEEVLPFKATFFQLSIETQSTTLPICISYEGQSNHLIPWYGKMSFGKHLLNLCHGKNYFAHLEILEEQTDNCKFKLSEKCWNLISKAYDRRQFFRNTI